MASKIPENILEKYRIYNRQYYRAKLKNSPKYKEYKRKYSKIWKERNPEKVKFAAKKASLKALYGLSYEDYEHLLRIQEGKCALCKKVKILHVDHCHKTGKVRGLLCGGCNSGIGFLQEDKEILKRALEYL